MPSIQAMGEFFLFVYKRLCVLPWAVTHDALYLLLLSAHSWSLKTAIFWQALQFLLHMILLFSSQ